MTSDKRPSFHQILKNLSLIYDNQTFTEQYSSKKKIN